MRTNKLTVPLRNAVLDQIYRKNRDKYFRSQKGVFAALLARVTLIVYSLLFL